MIELSTLTSAQTPRPRLRGRVDRRASCPGIVCQPFQRGEGEGAAGREEGGLARVVEHGMPFEVLLAGGHVVLCPANNAVCLEKLTVFMNVFSSPFTR